MYSPKYHIIELLLKLKSSIEIARIIAAAIMQAFSMRDFNFKSNSIVIFLYVLENLSSFNQVFFPRCMHFFSQKYAIFLKNMQFFLKKYALENALNFRIHIKKMQ